ncbi:unnamed protein product, partial [Symbiodinium pilosum]
CERLGEDQRPAVHLDGSSTGTSRTCWTWRAYRRSRQSSGVRPGGGVVQPGAWSRVQIRSARWSAQPSTIQRRGREAVGADPSSEPRRSGSSGPVRSRG